MARADETDKSAYEEQYRRYKEFLGYLKELGVKIPIRHCSNSAGIVESLESNHMDMVRAGIAIYGMYPSDEVDHNSVKLTPAMEIKSCITYIKEIEAGTAVSYGGTFVADHTMKVATIPVGYGDGYVRSLSRKRRCADPRQESSYFRPYLHGSVYGRCNRYPGCTGR